MEFPGFISSDSHVYEPPDLWSERMAPQFADRAPRVVREDSKDWWVCEGYKIASPMLGTAAGQRFGRPEERTLTLEERMSPVDQRFENVRAGGYIPSERIKDMDMDGIYADVIYPSAAFRAVVLVRDNELLKVICGAYNDWIAEFCNAYPARLKGIGLLTLDDIEWGVQELERCRRMGLVGGMIPTGPPEEMPYSRPEYDPLWAAAQDLEMPLSLHVGVRRPRPQEPLPNPTDMLPPVRSGKDYWVRLSLNHMIFGRVFERYPKLIVGSVEFENGWVPYFLSQIDYTYTQRTSNPEWPKFKDPQMLPSDFYRRNVFVSFQEDRTGIALRSVIGVHTLMWGSDYPHIESTFPKSREILDGLLADCSVEERELIVAGNAARVYSIE